MSRRGARLHIDWTACEGRGLCSEMLTEILAIDDWGYPLARDGRPEPAVPRELVAHARRAERLCPRLALRVLPEPPPTRPQGGSQLPPS